MAEPAASSWILDLIGNSRYLGVAVLMFAETLFPPIPSEVVMPAVGFLAAEGRLSLAGGIAAGTAGSLAGAYAWFEAARRIGAERLVRWAGRHGRWLTISPADIEHVCAWFKRHGHVAVMIGRVVPAVRTLISVPAGIAPMRPISFLVWSAIGASAWSSALAIVGFMLGGRYDAVVPFVGTFTNAVVGAALLIYAYRIVTFRR